MKIKWNVTFEVDETRAIFVGIANHFVNVFLSEIVAKFFQNPPDKMGDRNYVVDARAGGNGHTKMGVKLAG